MKKPIPSIDKTGYTRQLYYTLHQLNIQKTRLSPYSAVKFFNRVKFKNRTAVRKGCLLGYERLLQGPSTLSKLLVSNQM